MVHPNPSQGMQGPRTAPALERMKRVWPSNSKEYQALKQEEIEWSLVNLDVRLTKYVNNIKKWLQLFIMISLYVFSLYFIVRYTD